MANSSKKQNFRDLVKIMPFPGIFMASVVSWFCHLLTWSWWPIGTNVYISEVNFQLNFKSAPVSVRFGTRIRSDHVPRVRASSSLESQGPRPEDARPCTLLFHSSNDKYRLISTCVCSSGRVARDHMLWGWFLYFTDLYLRGTIMSQTQFLTFNRLESLNSFDAN